MDKKFYILNGDTFFDINLFDLDRYLGNSNLIIAATKKKNSAYSYLIKSNFITNLKNETLNGIVSGGTYLVKKKFFRNYPIKKFDLDKDIIWPNINNKKIKIKVFENPFHDIGSNLKEFSKTKKFLKRNFYKKCCFLDRDGVINKDLGYVHSKDKFFWNKNVIKAIKYLNQKNYLVVVISNQAGIAHGYYKEKDVTRLHDYMQNVLHKYGAHIDRFYFCPHHPNAKIDRFKRDCHFRKPNIGMFKKAFLDFDINKTKSFFIGDQVSDYDASKKIGLKFYWPKKDIYNQIKKIIK